MTSSDDTFHQAASGFARDEGRALVIGIDAYPFIRANPLLGCRSDADLMAKILERRGFEVFKLLDAEASREAVLETLENLAVQASPGDRIVVHWSGHGSRIRSSEGTWIETLVPHDSGRGTFENRDIGDWEIKDWVRRISRTTPYVTLVFDSCHAGGAARGLEGGGGGRIRSVPEDARPETLLAVKRRQRGQPTRRDLGPDSWLLPSQRYVLLAACRADETARECEDPISGRTHGALTFALAELLDRIETPASYRDLFEQIEKRFRERWRDQHPQLEGALDREIFGKRETRPQRFVSVAERQGSEVVLAGGRLQGLRPGSRWRVVPSGSRFFEGVRVLGELRVDRVDATRARAHAVRELFEGAMDVGDRAIEWAPADGASALAVTVTAEVGAGESQDDRADLERIRQRIGESPLLTLVDGHPASDTTFRVCRLARRSRRSPRETRRLVPQLGEADVERWAVVDSSGRQVMPPKRAAEFASIDSVVDNLERLARASVLRRLAPPPDQDLGDVISLEFLRRTFSGTAGSDGFSIAESEKAEPVEYREGDALAIRIRHHYQTPLFLSVLNLGLTGAVELLYPVRGAWEPLDPGGEIVVGDDEDLTLGLPSSYPFPGEVFTAEEEEIIVIATTRSADLELLRQGAVRTHLNGPICTEPVEEVPRSEVGSLGWFLHEAFQGCDRDVQRPVERKEPDRWTVERRTLRLGRSGAL